MQVYFVRHGQSILNAEGKHQFPETPLSELGLQQVQAVAERFSSIEIDALWSSPMQRAKQTAQAIATVKGMSVIEEPLLAEIRRPSFVQGKGHDDEQVAEYHQGMHEHVFDDDWKMGDAESFLDPRHRAVAVLQKLESLELSSLAVVSHGIFIVHLLSAMMFGESLTKRTFIPIVSFTNLSNTGLTVCEWNSQKNPNHWRLKTLNDDAHLGEVKSGLIGMNVGLGE